MSRLRDPKTGRFMKAPPPIPPDLMEEVKKAAAQRRAVVEFDFRDYRLDLESEPRAPELWRVVREGTIVDEK